MQDLAGKVAVVTGGASGIGLALARRFGESGMKLVLADIDGAELDKAAAGLREGGIETRAVTTDVASAESVAALAAATFKAFGTAHVVCNNAGVGPGGITWELPASVWEWVVGVNLWGVVNGVHAFVPRLVAQGEGHVVNTASVAGLIATPGMAPYSATKHAIVGLSKSLRHDLELAASAVKVSVLCPGFTRTRMNEGGRNWPERLGPPPATGLEPGHPRTRASYHERMATQAIEPSQVAEAVHAAILAERFWVLTEPGFSDRLRPHFEDVLQNAV